MNVFTFALKMLKREYKKSLGFGFILLFSFVVSLVFIDIMDNPLLVAQDVAVGGASWAQVSMPLSKTLPFLIICVCWVMILYASDYYLDKKLKEFSLIYLSGGTFLHVVLYVTIQIMIILLIVIPLSFIFGSICLNCLYAYMYPYLSITETYTIPFETYFGTAFTILPILMTIMLSIAGFSYRNTIQVLLGRSESTSGANVKETKVKTPIYLFLYFIGLYSIIVQTHYSVVYVIPTLIGTYAMYGIIKQGIPKLVRLWIYRGGIEKNPFYISLSNYVISMQGTIVMTLLMLCLITLLVPVFISQEPNTNEYVTDILGYFSIVFLLVIGIVCKFSDLIMNRKREFNVLSNIGFTYYERKKIIFSEVALFYSTIIVLPFPYIFTIGMRFVMNGELDIQKLLFIIAIYLLPTIISMFITFCFYNKTVNIPFKGESHE